MKKVVTLSLAFGICMIGYTQRQQNMQSKIKEVVIFTSKAQITREASTSLGKGNTELIFSGLSARIDPNSIQVTGKGALTILGTRHERNYLTNLEEPTNVKILKDSLMYYKSEIIELETLKRIYKKEESLLISNQVITGKDRGITVGELKDMADFYSSRLLQLARKTRVADVEIKTYLERQQIIQRQLSEWNAYYKKNTSSIIVEVSAVGTTKVNLQIDYVVYNASWYPIYDLRSSGTGQPIALNYKANIVQSTGVNWEDVKLKLSTANPNLSNVKPIIYPWYLDFERPVLYNSTPNIRSQKFEKGAAAQFKSEDEMEDVEEVLVDVESVADYTQTIETTLNTQFDISIPYTVNSGRKATTVDIKKESIAASYTYAVAPKLDQSAFLIARIANWDQYELLAGQANLFFEGTYVGKTYINPSNVGDTLELSLGRDKHIVVERKSVKDFTSKRLIGSNKKESYAFEINIRNTKKSPINIIIEDQMPISSNSDIEITQISLDEATWDKNTGKLRWELKLSSNEKKKISYSFEVKYPKNKKITGL